MVKSGVPLASNENQFKMGDPGLFYNYALLVPQTGNSSRTIKELETGLKLIRLLQLSIMSCLIFIFKINRYKKPWNRQ
jgi:hypothetical protein